MLVAQPCTPPLAARVIKTAAAAGQAAALHVKRRVGAATRSGRGALVGLRWCGRWCGAVPAISILGVIREETEPRLG